MSDPPALYRQAAALVLLLAATLGAGALGSMVTTPAIPGWYEGLVKPAFNPPNWVFAPVWTALYVLMAVAAFVVWRASPGPGLLRGARLPLVWFAIQLVLNLLWSLLFFGLRSPILGLLELPLLIVAIAVTARLFARRSNLAAWLLAPYLAWTGYALLLNAAIWWLNS
jgi:benzodiazapine receptor